ncbi:eukaryotic translation initiation factor 2 subunit 1-like [Babylonia areolata]|uniref:eukaryotic translation initiation factor 2 subunit 1-like n=1 Tax=Babylonia areolata TaxID=304850 RepID=UPI003FD6A5F5
MASEDLEDHPRCRFYLQPWPAEGDVVMATVTEVKDTATYVTLAEYGGQEAMLPNSELSNRRLRSVHKHVRHGQMLCVRVTRVLPDQGYVDVSKRQVDAEEALDCQHRYARGKTVQGVIGRVGQLLDMKSSQELEDLNHQITWRLDRLHDRRTAAYDVFQQAYSKPDVMNDLDLDPQTLGVLTQVIKHRFALRQVKVRGVVEVTCFGSDGVDAIRRALTAGKMAAASALPVQILVLAPPSYSVTCVALANQRAEALASVQTALAAIENTIGQFGGGGFHLRSQPCVDSETPTTQFNVEQ